MSGFVVHYGELRTGALLATVPAVDGSWSTELLASGDGKFSLPVNDAGKRVWQSTPAGGTFWAVEWADDGARRLVAGGPVWSKKFSARGAALSGSGMQSIFARRKLAPKVAADLVPKSDVVFSGLDLGSIIRGIVELVTTGTDAELPIVLEAARAGSHTRTYLGYEATWAEQRIKELTEVEDGPEFLLLPRFTPDFLGVEWELLTGTEVNPQLVGDTAHVLDATAPRQELVGEVEGEFDASTLGTTSWAVGGGTERAQVVRSASDTALTAQGFPLLEVETTSDSTDGALVQSRANGMRDRSKRPARSVSVPVDADHWYGLGARLGDLVTLIFDHPFLGRSTLTSRVLGESGALGSKWVKLTLADTLAEELF